MSKDTLKLFDEIEEARATLSLIQEHHEIYRPEIEAIRRLLLFLHAHISLEAADIWATGQKEIKL